MVTFLAYFYIFLNSCFLTHDNGMSLGKHLQFSSGSKSKRYYARSRACPVHTQHNYTLRFLINLRKIQFFFLKTIRFLRFIYRNSCNGRIIIYSKFIYSFLIPFFFIYLFMQTITTETNHVHVHDRACFHYPQIRNCLS